MATRILSKYSIALFSTAIAVVLVAFALIAAGVGGEFGATVVSDVAELFVVGLAGIAIVRSAFMLDWRSGVGRLWLLVGLGTLSFFVGDVIWTFVEVVMRADVPYPGIPDVFYLLEYPLMAVGIMSAGLAFKGLVDLKRPMAAAGAAALVLAGIVYFGLLGRLILPDPSVSFGEKALSTLYPLADVFLMIAPAVFVLAVVSALGGGRLAWPWRAVATGAVLIALADTGYSWLEWSDLYRSGSVIDFGWMLGHAFIMLGALYARDLAKA